MNNNDIPVWEKYTLTIEEASKYFRIGENKLRRLAEENKDAGWLIMNGNRIQIKRRQFEKVIDKLDAIPDVYLEVQHPCWSCNSNSSSANASAGVR